MSTAVRSSPELATLAAMAGAPSGLSPRQLTDALGRAGIDPTEALQAAADLIERGMIAGRGGAFELTGAGARALLDVHAEIERALDPSPTTPGMETCPSVPFLTTVQTHWIDAISLNYAVDPDALARLLPRPLVPEIHKGRAWVQLLVSRLREMRPQGTPGLFGVNFHQASYRAAVQYVNAHGSTRRGGYFVRSETDHPVMRAVGNALVEFKFHDFGLATMSLARIGDTLRLQVAPREAPAFGAVDVSLDVREGQAAPAGSLWRSCEEMHEPLVACYDAFGVDPSGWVYVLTIDREPWRERFAAPKALSVEYFERGPLGGGAAVFDSALYIPKPCGYRWRPLRRERF